MTSMSDDIAEGTRQRMIVLEADLKRAYQANAHYQDRLRGQQERLDAALQRIQDVSPIVDAARRWAHTDAQIWNDEERALAEAVFAFEMKGNAG